MTKWDSWQKENKVCSFCGKETSDYTEGLTSFIVICQKCRDEIFPKKESGQ